MGSKIAGVALAAVVGVCALGAERAEAALLYFSFDFAQDAGDYDVVTSASGVADTTGRGSSYSVHVNYASRVIGVPDMDKNYNIYARGTGGADVYYDPSYGPVSEYYYFDDFISFIGNDAPNGYKSASSTFSPYGYPRLNIDVSALVSNVSAVPVPSSAPLFGISVLALGGATYVRRRKMKVSPAA